MEEIINENTNLATTMSGYHGLPLDLDLAKLVVHQAKVELDELQTTFDIKIQSMV